MPNEEQSAVLTREPKAAKRRQVNGQQADIAALQDAFEADDWNAVRTFLQTRPELVSLLLEARPQIRRISGADAVVRLTLVPEYEDNTSLLFFADIQTHEDALTAFEKMNRFESEWWLDAASQAEGLLHFSAEFA